VNGPSEGNKHESREKPELNVAADVACLTDEFGHEGSPEETFEMKKSLLATVAAVSLIAGAGFASAEGAKDQPAMKGGAAGGGTVQSEPAMKHGADIKAGAERKGKAETTGAGVESKSEMKAEPKAGAKAETKAETKADSKAGDTKANADTKAKPSTTGQATEQKGAPAAKSATDTKAAPAAKSATDTKAGTDTKTNAAAADSKSSAGGSVSLTTEQKTKIRTSVIQSSSAPKVSRSQINFNISIGTVVPRSVHFVTVPATLVEIHPAWRGYSYFIVDDEIIIVEPSSFKIIAVLTV
jgi:hypothetical protein